jgi:hypothetical protein
VRPQTSAWLDPMIRATRGGDNNFRELIKQASVVLDDELPHAARVVGNVGINWIRFGELLRTELGWEDTYPGLPAKPD